MGTTEISTVSNITLVTLQGSPATTGFMAEVFERIAELDINIDMISMPPNHGANAGLSFTISDQDLIEVLSFANTLKTVTGIKVIDGKKGAFVSMPQYTARDGEWKDSCFPITAEFREELSEAVLEAYEETEVE